jgi:hypothetical protein
MFQTTRGAKASNQEAAHCLPCQILVTGIDPAALTVGGKKLATRVQDDIRSQFAKVTVLPRCFNVADKTAERVEHGLTRVFVDACSRVLDCRREVDSPRNELCRHVGERYGELYTIDIWPINRNQVKDAYELVWLPGAERAYASAGNEIENKGAFLSADDDPDEVLWILEKYLDFHGQAPSALRDDQMSNLELGFLHE